MIKIVSLLILLIFTTLVVGQSGLTQVQVFKSVYEIGNWYYLESSQKVYSINGFEEILDHSKIHIISSKPEFWNVKNEVVQVQFKDELINVNQIDVPIFSVIVNDSPVNLYLGRDWNKGSCLIIENQEIKLVNYYCNEYCDVLESQLIMAIDSDGGSWLIIEIKWEGCAWGTQRAILKKNDELWCLINEHEDFYSKYGANWHEYEFNAERNVLIVNEKSYVEFGDTILNVNTVKLDCIQQNSDYSR